MFSRFLIAASALALAAPLSAFPLQGDEPTLVPTNVEQGVDFVYVDPQLRALGRQPRQNDNWMLRTVGYDWGDSRQQSAPNPIFLQLRQGLDQYREFWGRLPRIHIPEGSVLKPGSQGERLDMLRIRLGMEPGAGYDEELTERVADYQRVHGIGSADGVAGTSTLASLNRGPEYYERLIMLNLERARRLPSAGEFQRYVVVDSGSAEVFLFEQDRVADRMKAIVGSPRNKTPMMAVVMQSAKVNPYWNVPPDMIRSFTAAKVLSQGVSYLDNYNYTVLSDWSRDAEILDPATIDWKAVAAGGSKIRVRQRPGPWNSMGEVKFETPNQYGIYLHDTPGKQAFAKADRWVSNGCVRLEDASRFASWVMGGLPQSSTPEQVIDLPRPVPVYMTYLTAVPGPNGVQFRADPYGFDQSAMQRLFGGSREMASAF